MAKKIVQEVAGSAPVYISVASKREGFRRAGLVFGKEPVVFDISLLAPAELAAIRGEPMLVITEIA